MSTTHSPGILRLGGSYTVWDELKAEIAVHRQLIQRELEAFGPLLDDCRAREPSPVEVAALGMMLQSTYNGFENQFKRVAAAVDGAVPTGEAWHRELLDSLAAATATRPAVISEALRCDLAELLQFRHAFRHAYGFMLDWHRMRHLAMQCREIVAQVDEAIDAFLASLDEAPDA